MEYNKQKHQQWKSEEKHNVLESTKRDIGCLLPDPASMMLDGPLRSATSRDELGMLTGSERTGWILHTHQVYINFITTMI